MFQGGRPVFGSACRYSIVVKAAENAPDPGAGTVTGNCRPRGTAFNSSGVGNSEVVPVENDSPNPSPNALNKSKDLICANGLRRSRVRVQTGTRLGTRWAGLLDHSTRPIPNRQPGCNESSRM